MDAHASNHAEPTQKVENGSSSLRFIFLGLAFLVAVVLGLQFKNSLKNKKENKGTTGNVSSPVTADSVFTVYLKSTDSIKLKNYNGFKLLASTGGTKEKPVPYFRKNGDGNEWEKFGNGHEDLNGSPSFNVWLKGADSATSTRIWYWYQKI